MIFNGLSNLTNKDKKNLQFNLNILSRIILETFDNKDSYNQINYSNVLNISRKIGIINEDKEYDILKKLVTNTEKLYLSLSILAEEVCLKKENNCDICPIKKFCSTYRKEVQNLSIQDTTSPTLIDLFSGAGGLSLGFHQEGFKIVFANDIEEVCTNTYKLNHPEVVSDKILNGDIKTIVNNIEDYVLDKNIDIIVGGPPCQSFSMANRQRVIDDPRNELYKYFVKFVEKVQPKFFLMENVKGMLGVSEQVKQDFETIGYNVDCGVFNSKNFSVPQNRERLIFVGNRIGISSSKIIQDMSLIKLEVCVLKDALELLRPLEPFRLKNASELDTLESGKLVDKNIYYPKTTNYIDLINNGEKSVLVFNHKTRFNNDRDIEIYSRMKQGDNSASDSIFDIMPYQTRRDIFKDKYFKLIEDKVCKTITAHMKFDCNMYIHPNQSRGLTPREAARIQSYPDSYFFWGPLTKTYMQIGNSVPPLMSRIFAKEIKKYL